MEYGQEISRARQEIIGTQNRFSEGSEESRGQNSDPDVESQLD